MLRVGVNGYGTIGKRVTDAIIDQPDMRVAGIAKRSPSLDAAAARERGIDLFAADRDGQADFEDAGLAIAGPVEELVDRSDVIVDATPAGCGEEHVPMYRRRGTPVILQGGEAADAADASLTGRLNTDAARSARVVRVVSCNTTGLARTLGPLADRFPLDGAQATLIRRGGDPDQPDRGPIDDIVPDPVTLPSHHARDLNRMLPDVHTVTMAVRVPCTRMHLHAVTVRFEQPPDARVIRRQLAEEPRIFLIPGGHGADSLGALTVFGEDIARPRGDIWETCVWAESIAVTGRELHLFQAIDQRCNVVPENIDAIRAIAGGPGPAEGRGRTNEALGIGLTEHQPATTREPATR